jgi:hypothetical protein
MKELGASNSSSVGGCQPSLNAFCYPIPAREGLIEP